MEGQYVAYTFYRLDPAWRRLPVEQRQAQKDEFAETVDSFAERFEHLRAYTTAGVRPDADFFLWKITERYDDLEELGARLSPAGLTRRTPTSRRRRRPSTRAPARRGR
jgi:chlorite dismutase